MNGPPPTSRPQPVPTDLTWRNVLACLALVAAIPIGLWVASQPVVGTAALGAGLGLVLGGRTTHRLARCFRDCGGFGIELGGKVRVCVTQSGRTDLC